MTHRAAARVPSTGRSRPSPARTRLRVARRSVRRSPGVAAALPVGFAPRPGSSATTAGRRSAPGPGSVLGLPDGYARRSPGSCARCRAPGPACCSRSRPPRTCTPRPATRSRSAAPGRAGAGARRRRRRPPQRRLAVPDRRRAARARSPRPRPTTSSCCRGDLRRTRRCAAPRPRSTRASTTRAPRQPERRPTRPSPAARATSRRGSPAAGLVGDNLGTALDQARKDALYAQLLFLFLGLPGALLAGLVTATIAAAGADRRRRDSALLRARGATTRQLVRLALAEAALAGVRRRRGRARRRAG